MNSSDMVKIGKVGNTLYLKLLKGEYPEKIICE